LHKSSKSPDDLAFRLKSEAYLYISFCDVKFEFFDHICILPILESLTYVCIDTIYQMTYQPPMPPPINCTEIPGFLKRYREQINPDCECVKYVYALFMTRGHYVNSTNLEHLILFIEWCDSSMVFTGKYTDTIVRNFLVNGVTHINHEPVFKDRLKLFTDNGVNLKKFRKCTAKISKFRSEVYMSLFSDILEFENNEQVRYKKELFDAAQCGNYAEVHRIMDSKHSSIEYDDIRKALNVSIWNEYNDVAQILIHYLNLRRLKINSSFQVAVSHCNIECVHMFLDNGIDINVKTPEHNCNGYNTKYTTALYFATVNNDYSMVEELINLRADINIGSHSYESRLYGGLCQRELLDSPLYFASKFGRSMDIVELLINSKASVDATDESLKTPLHAATQAGYIEIVKRLLDAKSDFNATAMGSGPNTPLQIAQVNGHDEILTLFR
jgi:ankyrin repeat protein